MITNPQVPQIAEEYQRSFRILRGLKCDIPLGSHPAMYNLAEKYPKLGKGPNPFIDPEGYKAHVAQYEKSFEAALANPAPARGGGRGQGKAKQDK